MLRIDTSHPARAPESRSEPRFLRQERPRLGTALAAFALRSAFVLLESPPLQTSLQDLGRDSVAFEVVDHRSQAVGRDLERRKRDRQLETPPACASRIQVEHPADRIDLRHVRMAGDNDVYAEGHWIDLQRLEV